MNGTLAPCFWLVAREGKIKILGIYSFHERSAPRTTGRAFHLGSFEVG
jgi:hypothetical protein